MYSGYVRQVGIIEINVNARKFNNFCNTFYVFYFAEEVILAEERTTEEEKMHIMEARRRAAKKKKLKKMGKSKSTDTEEEQEEEVGDDGKSLFYSSLECILFIFYFARIYKFSLNIIRHRYS